MSWVWPFLATLLVQATGSFLLNFIPALAPQLAQDLEWRSTEVGFLFSFTAAGTIAYLLLGTPVLLRAGAIRTLQIGLALMASGVAALLLTPLVFAQIGATLIGLGYGPATPAASEILHRYAPPQHRNLIFSAKQAGSPIGLALGSVILPPISKWFGWHVALLGTVCVALLTIVLVQPLRKRIDADRDPTVRLGFGTLFAVKSILNNIGTLNTYPLLYTVFAGVCLAFAQGAWTAFFISYAVEELHQQLVVAGLLVGLMQVFNIAGRVALGWITDRVGSPRGVLAVVAGCSAATSAVLALVTPGWSILSLGALAATAGITVMTWNGVQIAEIARLVSPSKIKQGASASTMFVFIGYVLGPLFVGAFGTKTGRVDMAFFGVAVVAIVPLVVGLFELVYRRSRFARLSLRKSNARS